MEEKFVQVAENCNFFYLEALKCLLVLCLPSLGLDHSHAIKVAKVDRDVKLRVAKLKYVIRMIIL